VRDLRQRVKDVAIQYALTVSAIEALDVGILVGCPFWMNCSVMFCSLPPGQFLADEFRAIVESNLSGLPRTSISSVRARTTRAAGRLVSISILSASRL